MLKIKIMNDLIHCTICKKEKDPDMFIGTKGQKYKLCSGCREQTRKFQMKNKCPHGKRKVRCPECGGSSICEHKIIKQTCHKCGGNGICKHGKHKQYCKRGCGGSAYCEHGTQKNLCRDGCGGSSICIHNKRKAFCSTCDPNGYLCQGVRSRICMAMKAKKSKKSLEYLGCDIEFYRNHIEKQFSDGMSWDNYGEWEIDHIIPLTYGNPTIEETAERLHYANTQPLWKVDNMKKGNRWIG